MPDVWLLAGMIFLAAVLYSSVGHAGASGYLASMALLGMAPAVMKPTALVLNILVASIATFRFYREGCFHWRTLWPFALGSIPLAFVGGAVHIPGRSYKVAVGIILLFAAFRLLQLVKQGTKPKTGDVPIGPAVGSGAGIGLLSGLTGTGGGIFLSPLLLFMGWAETRETAGVSAAFILLNSIAGLAGALSSLQKLPAELPYLAVAAVCGGLIGSELGSKRLGAPSLRIMLALVLVLAGLKLILT